MSGDASDCFQRAPPAWPSRDRPTRPAPDWGVLGVQCRVFIFGCSSRSVMSKRSTSSSRLAALLAVLFVAAAPPPAVRAQERSLDRRPVARATRGAPPPRIDGHVLDEPAWQAIA